MDEYDNNYSPSSAASRNMVRRWARRVERYCCACATYFPLVFVYGLSSWAAFVLVSLSTTPSKVNWIGPSAGVFGFLLFVLLNCCYTVAVFTPPGSTTNDNGYATLPTHVPPSATSFTVKANGELRFCKKCQARKPDRAHHCSTCRRCVLKMDHHCPWLATCVGLRNHKAFLLFLIYSSLFSAYACALTGSWTWYEIMANTQYVESLMPINYIMLCVISGVIAVVVGAFTGWHIYLASRGQTTIECLEKTRYLSPLRKTMQQTFVNQHNGTGVPLPKYGQQLLDIHQNAIPGVTRPEEGEEFRPFEVTRQEYTADPELTAGSRRMTYDELERYRARKRYEEYLDEEDSSKLPNAFDLGAKRNLLNLFGPSPWLWPIPICNTLGDGWHWEASPKWLAARERLSKERQEQRERERVAGWGDEEPASLSMNFSSDQTPSGAGRHYSQPPAPPSASSGRYNSGTMPGRRAPSKADRVLGRDPNLYVDTPFAGGEAVSMRRLNSAGQVLGSGHDDISDGEYASSSDEAPLTKQEQAAQERRSLNAGPVPNGSGWGRSGASGLLRKPSRASSNSREYKEDDGVD